jgi:pyroglutamyl-peptidase
MLKIPPPTSSLKVKVIVTGFSPFGSHTTNPSAEAVLELPDNVKFDDNRQPIEVAKLILPVCCLEAFNVLSAEVEKCLNSPFALVLSGLADNRGKISLERFALNVRDFRMPDNNGHELNEEHIDSHGPDALRSKVPLKDLAGRLTAAGFSCEISNHAGTFVCNETYYRSLLSWQENPNCRGIIFVHVPPYEAYKSAHLESTDAREPRELFTAALKEISSYLAQIS